MYILRNVLGFFECQRVTASLQDKKSKVPLTGQPALTSMMGLEAKTFSSTLASLAEPLTVAKYLMAYLADTVFPAPDSLAPAVQSQQERSEVNAQSSHTFKAHLKQHYVTLTATLCFKKRNSKMHVNTSHWVIFYGECR